MDEATLKAAEENRAKGDGGMMARLLGEMIKTPAFRDIVKSFLRDLDPEDARELVKTFMWQDAEFTLSLMGAIPQLVNYMTVAGLELGVQAQNFPPGLLNRFFSQFLEGVDTDLFAQYPEVYGPLLEALDAAQAVPFMVGKTLNTGSEFLLKVAENNPDFVGDALSEVDGKLVMKAGFAALRSTARWGINGIKKMIGI